MGFIEIVKVVIKQQKTFQKIITGDILNIVPEEVNVILEIFIECFIFVANVRVGNDCDQVIFQRLIGNFLQFGKKI